MDRHCLTEICPDEGRKELLDATFALRLHTSFSGSTRRSATYPITLSNASAHFSRRPSVQSTSKRKLGDSLLKDDSTGHSR